MEKLLWESAHKAKIATKPQDTNNGRRTELGIRDRKNDRSVTVFTTST